MELAPLDTEIDDRSRAAVETALATLRAQPPARCDFCHGRDFAPPSGADPAGAAGYWRCRTCWRGTQPAPPTPAEEAAIAARVRTETRAAIVDEHTARLAEHLRVRRRDWRPLTPAVVRGMRDALLHRADPRRYAATPAAAAWLDHGPLLALVQTHLERAGREEAPFGLSRYALAMRALTRNVRGWVPASARQSGYHTTSDFPAVLDEVAHTLFLDAYGATVRSFVPWTTAITVADFRATVVTVVEFPELLSVPEHAEYRSGSPFGPAAPVRLTTFGRIVPFTMQAVLRDDVASFGQLLQGLGVSAAEVEADTVYDVLTSNPTMPDGAPLFSAAHENLLPAAALDAASLATASATLARISGHGRPAFLLVGTSDGPTARRLVTEETPPAAGAASGVLQVIVDDRIAGGFYVTTDPRERPTLVAAHLGRSDGPELLAQDGWDVDARLYKGRTAFGAAAVNARGMVYTPPAS